MTLEQILEQAAIAFIESIEQRMVQDPIDRLGGTAEQCFDRHRRDRSAGELVLNRLIARVGFEMEIDKSELIQLFAGYLTEHTMGMVVEGGPRSDPSVVRVKLQDSRGALVERNDDSN